MTTQKRSNKGQFIRSKELQRREKVRKACAERQKNNRQKNADINRENLELSVCQYFTGSRITELCIFAKHLKCGSCHTVLSIEDSMGEARNGLHSTLMVKCRSCQKLTSVPLGGYHKVNHHAQKYVKSEKHSNIPTNAVLGTIHAGIGYGELIKILACMDILTFSSRTYKKYEREIGPAIEAAAKKSYQKAALQERKMVLEKLNELRDHIPRACREEFMSEMQNAITANERGNDENFDSSLGAIVNIIVSYDMGWSKRGNGRAYDSLNGYGAMIGFLTGKIIDYRTCNRKYKACDMGIPKEQHDCRLNFRGSAKAMEASAGADVILNSNILKEAGLNVKIVEYADNAEKYSVSASSQANEAFNHTVTTKFPKNKSFSTSESGDFRIGSAVLQKNEGERYLVELKNELQMIVTPHLIKHCERLDITRLKKSEKANTKEQKIKRIINKQKRDNLRTKLENKEGVTYQSNMGFKFNSLKKQIEQNEVFDGTLVFFDLETSGRSNDADILQIAAISDEKSFSVYVQPTQQIDKFASAVNGLVNIDGCLYFKGEKVHTSPISNALIAFNEFLNKMDGQSLLVAHNASFDMRYLLRDIAKHSLIENFTKTIYGFTDSLKLFRAQFPQRKLEKGKGMFKLETLAIDLLGENSSKANFHNATYDVLILQELVNNNLSGSLLLESSISFQASVSNFVQNSVISLRRNELVPLKSILAPHMVNKLASAHVTYSDLQELYKAGGESSVKNFLSEKVNKKIRFSKNPVILQKMIDHFKLSCNTI